MKPSLPLQLSPSLNHHRVLKTLTPSLSFQGGDVARWQQSLRRKLRQLTGLAEMPSLMPLNPRTLWKRDHELGSIEKIVFSAEASSDVTAYLCLPHGAEPPFTTMICLQGHTTGMHVSIGVQRENESQPMAVEGDRDFGLQCMRQGLAALCIEQRGFGERREQHQEKRSSHGCHDAAMHALMLGRTLLAERVYDVDRGLDYLQTRSDIDMKKVGVMGNSGGGMVAMFSAGLLPRVRFAMPSCAFCSFRDSFMSIYHCTDNYIPGLLKYAEAADVLGLAASRPLVVVAGKEDDIFPIAGVRREFRRLKDIYRTCQAEDKVRLVVGQGGHRFYAKEAWPVLLRLIENV